VDNPEQGIRIIDGKRYVNNTRAARELGYSAYGWRQLRDKKWKEGKLDIYEFDDDTKNSYVLETDLELLKMPQLTKRKPVNGVD
jgi:hypothetical protein